jgi:hypothetical protein
MRCVLILGVVVMLALGGCEDNDPLAYDCGDLFQESKLIEFAKAVSGELRLSLDAKGQIVEPSTAKIADRTSMICKDETEFEPADLVIASFLR